VLVTDAQKLTVVRIAHATVFSVMTVATVVVVYAGVTGARGTWLGVAIALLVAEAVVFLANGRRCPLTQWALKYGAPSGHVFDLFAPNWLMQAIFRIETWLSLAGLGLLSLRWFGIIG
jgi:hypothetical protein